MVAPAVPQVGHDPGFGAEGGAAIGPSATGLIEAFGLIADVWFVDSSFTSDSSMALLHLDSTVLIWRHRVKIIHLFIAAAR